MRQLKFLIVALFLLVLVANAQAATVLFKGNNQIGQVDSIELDGVTYVSLENIADYMGFKYSQTKDGVILNKGREKLRVVLKSAGAWRGNSLIPLSSVPFEKDGALWLDTSSAVALFQKSAGKGKNNILRFGKVTNVPIKKDVEIEPAATLVENDTPEIPQSQNIINTPENNNSESVNLDDMLNQQLAKKEARHQKNDKAPVQQIVFEATDKTQQPKHETFEPDKQAKDINAVYFSGELKWVRWTVSKSGNFKKVLAVISVSDNAKPSVTMQDNDIHIFFKTHSENLEGVPSPFENIKASVKTDYGISELIFENDAIKVEKSLLKTPDRIILEFIYPADKDIKRVSQPLSLNLNSNANISSHQNLIIQPEEDLQSQNITNAFDYGYDYEEEEHITQVMAASKSKAKAKPKLIVIDPGHGGKDPGARGNDIIEKDINLAIGLALGRILRSAGYNVIMTRATDVYLTLQERTDIANNAEADLFVSVHVNALPKKNSMSGFEIYIMALPTDKDALELAKIENREYIEGKGYDVENVDSRTELLLKILGDMQQNNKISESSNFAGVLFNAGKRAGLPMRRIAQAPFFVIRGSGMPAVLLETGYLTNANEAKNLADPVYQNKIAQAMANGIANYLRK